MGIDAMDKLVVVRKVVGFAGLGIIPNPRFIKLAENYLGDIKSEFQTSAGAFEQAQSAISTLGQCILPSQAICRSGVAEVDQLLRPMRETARSRSAEQISIERPRAH
jgi:hypothetical protein